MKSEFLESIGLRNYEVRWINTTDEECSYVRVEDLTADFIAGVNNYREAPLCFYSTAFGSILFDLNGDDYLKIAFYKDWLEIIPIGLCRRDFELYYDEQENT